MSDRLPLPNCLSLSFAEEIYARYLDDPATVDETWRRFFDSQTAEGARPSRVGPSFSPASVYNPPSEAGTAGESVSRVAIVQDRLDQLVRAYRVRGHLIARVDPLDLPRGRHAELEPAFYGLHEADMDRPVSSRTIAGMSGAPTIRQVLDRMRNTYCRSIGAQFMHIDDLDVKLWLQTRMESSENRLALTRDEQFRILRALTNAVTFEDFIQKKYLGAKRFSLEGAESLIPLLGNAIEEAGSQGIEEIVLGMAHRGRLNVLANVMGKPPRRIFAEFEDRDLGLFIGRGDVKYHLGHSHDWHTASGQKVHLTLCFNPSHLEFVGPVALGRLRAKQTARGDFNGSRSMAILIHGDAAFAGQGVIQETLNLSQVEHYSTGGTVHIIVNNQIGFTTCPREGRSSIYASDVARMLQIPIFHVNGEDPEAVAQVVRLAVDFRTEFHRDVVIDMYCYRRYGHNEGDEPAFTQPAMYKAIRARKSVREGYLEGLLALGEVSRETADEWQRGQRRDLDLELKLARRFDFHLGRARPQGAWSRYLGGLERDIPEAKTAVDRARLSRLMHQLATLPESFKAHPKLNKFLDLRHEMADGQRPLDWAAAEALALATLAVEGTAIRFAGQDTGRGTFSQRNAILHDARGTGECYTPLTKLTHDQGRVEIINSPLSEIGVLGYEYGFSLDTPSGLTIWEAQFGDFANVAQVLFDQFIVSGEDKWNRLSGLIVLLPHGLEGQGPEHSSARLERFLSLAAEDNIQVVNPTTPAQYFHLLRRQVHRDWRKPLIVMSPKSLLRLPAATSSLDELSTGRFHRILANNDPERARATRRVLLCSGKIYYELVEQRKKKQREDVAILRIEQLYPLDLARLEAALAPYPERVGVLWVQEEPENMGAWRYLKVIFGDRLLDRHAFTGIYRQAAASPATGSNKSHRLEQNAVLELAFAGM